MELEPVFREQVYIHQVIFESTMIDELVTVLQVIIAVVIIAVWVFRPRLETSFRAGNAKNIVEEFAVYGLPKWSVYAVGITKMSLATLLILGIWYTSLVQYAALGMGILMAGAVVCHLKTKGDPLSRATPASLMLIMCAVVFYLG
jgi:hypothetical protein